MSNKALERLVWILIYSGLLFACLGVFLMLAIAAFIEAFWSSIGAVPAAIKYGVAALLWALVLAWLALGGRDRDAAR